MKRKSKRWERQLILFLILLGCILLWIAIRTVQQIPVGYLQAWAVISAIAIPTGTYLGWRFGTLETRAHMDGVETGVGAVMRAADKASLIKTRDTRAEGRRAPGAEPAGQPDDLPPIIIQHAEPQTPQRIVNL